MPFACSLSIKEQETYHHWLCDGFHGNDAWLMITTTTWWCPVFWPAIAIGNGMCWAVAMSNGLCRVALFQRQILMHFLWRRSWAGTMPYCTLKSAPHRQANAAVRSKHLGDDVAMVFEMQRSEETKGAKVERENWRNTFLRANIIVCTHIYTCTITVINIHFRKILTDNEDCQAEDRLFLLSRENSAPRDFTGLPK